MHAERPGGQPGLRAGDDEAWPTLPRVLAARTAARSPRGRLQGCLDVRSGAAHARTFEASPPFAPRSEDRFVGLTTWMAGAAARSAMQGVYITGVPKAFGTPFGVRPV